MRWKPKGWTLICVLLAMPGVVTMMTLATAAQVGSGSSIATTQVADTIYRADGTAATGTVVVSWGAFTTPTGQTVPSGSTSAAIAAGGVLRVQLAPNAGATPMGSYYTAVYHLDDGTVSREYWVVPVSQTPVALSAVRSTVLPTSVAMQTVSKTYVDTAIAAAVTGHPLDSTTPYVVKVGDAMTGPLVLPGDPTSATQAADKHYVDTAVSSVTGGLGQKVSTLPAATQVVTQPVGTALQVNNLNGVEYASQYVTGRGDNGIANAVGSPDCANGCEVKAEQSYNSNEIYTPQTWNSSNSAGTHVEDSRNGERHDSYLNPTNAVTSGSDAGQIVDVVSTRSAASVFQRTGSQEPTSIGVLIMHEGLAGGSNLFPQSIEGTVPYFKSDYSALSVVGNYNTLGQHVLTPKEINCYGVGDCLIGSQFLTASGGFRDNADEGAHPFDLQIQEDSRVFQGTCSAGCAPGSTVVTVAATTAAGTQGEGRFLIDKNPAHVLTAGQLTGNVTGVPGAGATFSGTSFGVSVFLSTAQIIPSQANDVSPGTVTFAIATSGVPAGFATNTASLPGASGVACVTDIPNGYNPNNYEMANYTVVDGTHLQMTLNKAHAAGTTVAAGGLCGYGLEQTVDTTQGIRQVFPVIGSFSSTGLYYSAGITAVVGRSGESSAYLNLSMPVATIVRNGNVVTVTTAGNVPTDLNGLTLTVAGVADSSYNGSYSVTTTGPNTLTYASAGANSSSTGGSIGILTGGYALYPMAEVLKVFNPATKSVDGQMVLAANNVPWAANDLVEQPHYYQESIGADTEFVTQTTPRPTVTARAGIQYQGNVGPGMHGWGVTNASPASNYFGHGGTHGVPDTAYEAGGIWQRTMIAQAGEQAVFGIHCNSHGCGNWNSGYNLFELDSNASVDTVFFQPLTSALSMTLRGTNYSFTPQGFTAGTVNAGTLNATTINATTINAATINGAVAASQLPVFVASGTTHAQGVVPDPGAAAGTTRYLREDGSWVAPVQGSSSNTALPAGALVDYAFKDGNGTVLTDASGNGNNGTLGSGAQAPTWTATGLSFASAGQGVSLPVAVNAAKTFLFGVYIQPLTNNSGVVTSTVNQYPILLSNSQGGGGFNIMYQKSLSANAFDAQYIYAPTLFASGSRATSSPCYQPGFHVEAVTLGTSGSSVDHVYLDGVECTYITQSSSAGLQTTGNFWLGSSATGVWSSSGLIGTMYRFIAYGTQLTAGQVQVASAVIRNDVASRGAQVSPVPVGQVSPQLNAIGDSITVGYGATTPWPSLLNLTNQQTYTVSNWGITGIPSQAIASSEPYRVAPLCPTSLGPSVATVFAGTNDFNVAQGNTASTVFSYLTGEVQVLKQAGCRVFLMTMISRTGNDLMGATNDADKNQLDALILTSWKAIGADGVIDVAANPLLGADGANANATYFQADNVHPKNAGLGLIASAVSNGLNYYFGYSQSNPNNVTAATYTMLSGDGYVTANPVANQTLTLPSCIGPSGATYTIANAQSAFTVGVVTGSATQLINGLPAATVISVPSNGSVAFQDIANPKSVSGCYWATSGGGAAKPAGESVVAFSATPTFATTAQTNVITLAGNITGFTIGAGTAGQNIALTFCQNATGNFTVAGVPANVKGFMTIGATASKCSAQSFAYSANQAAWLAMGAGVINQ